MGRKMINLAKVIDNKNCFGFVFRFKNGRWFYQNDNGLGLDLESINFEQPLIKKIYVYKRYYVYQVRGGYEPTPADTNATYKEMISLIKECHRNIIPLTKKDEKRLRKYWGY